MDSNIDPIDPVDPIDPIDPIDPMGLLEIRIKVESPDEDAGPSSSPAFNHNGINDEEEDFGELSKICRLCGVVPSKPTTVLKIFENECQRKQISEKINKYLPIQVLMEDPLPKTICANCIELLENWDGLVKRTKIIEEQLKEKCRNDQPVAINKPTQQEKDTQDSASTNKETVPIIENYTFIREDDHGVSSDPHLLSAIIKSMLTDDYFKMLDIDKEGSNLEYVCQICPEKPASRTIDNLCYHLTCSHPTYIINKQFIEKFIKENITFEEILDDSLIDEDPEVRKTIQLPNYFCPFCDSAFSSPTRLVCHLNKHIEVNLDDGLTCCDNYYPNKKSFVGHLQTAHVVKNVDGKEICKSCDFATSDTNNLQLHISEAHPESKIYNGKDKKDPSPKNQKFIPAVCPECDKVFSNKYNMLVHMKNHSKSSVKFACDKCNRTYKSQGNLSHHKKLAHEGLLPFPCPLCGEAFPSKMARDVHTRIHTGSKPFCCQLCDKSFRAKNSLERHIDMHLDIRKWSPYSDADQDEMYGSAIEQIVVGTAADFYTEPSSSDDEPLATMASKNKTDLYKKFYIALKHFRDHFASDHHGQVSHSDFSDSTDSEYDEVDNAQETDLKYYDDLTDHNAGTHGADDVSREELHAARRRVDGKLRYDCRQCGRSLASAHSLLYHARIHSGARPCVCHLCGKQFRAPGGLARHLADTHRAASARACALCRRSFASAHGLRQHARLHSGERPHVCPRCARAFATRAGLHAHARTHAARRPHACALCGAAFRLRAALARHRLAHSGERPHACALCPRAFRSRHELGAHALAHSGARPHPCALCSAAFRQRRALRLHCSRMHPDHAINHSN